MPSNHCSKTSGSQQYWELKQQWQQWQQAWQKSNWVRLANNNFAPASHFFVRFFFPLLHDCAETAAWNFLILCAHFLEYMNITQQFSFSKLTWYFWIISTTENFANISQIKWIWIRFMKFETLQIHF